MHLRAVIAAKAIVKKEARLSPPSDGWASSFFGADERRMANSAYYRNASRRKSGVALEMKQRHSARELH
jgi:hypothetical protein